MDERHGDYTEYMHNLPTWHPPEAAYLKIEVSANDIDATFETNVCCALRDCGKTVDIDSRGPKTVQNVSCPEHGFLTSFPDRTALGEFIRRSANKILAIDGHPLIDVEAAFIVGQERKLESMD